MTTLSYRCKHGTIRWGILLALLAVLSASFAVRAQERLKLSAGIEYTTGDYGGTDDIDEWYVPFTARYTQGTWIYRLTVPYLRVTAPTGGVIIGIGPDGLPIYSGGTGRSTESGLGDVIASVTYAGIYKNIERGVLVDLTGKIKLGTADTDRGLGTGEDDYTIGADLLKRNKPYTMLLGLAYTWRGDPPGLSLDNTFATYIGVFRDLTDKLDAGVMYTFRDAPLSSQDDPEELLVDMSYRLSSTSELGVYGILGLSDGSPDWGIGVTFGYALDLTQRAPLQRR